MARSKTARVVVDPLSIGAALVKLVGQPLTKKVMQWREGSEANRLVKLLKPQFPAAQGLLTQPAALRALWFYAETGEFQREEMVRAVRPLMKSDEEAAELAEAIRTTQWRALRDKRQQHFEFDRLAAEIRANQLAGEERVLARIEEALAGFARSLPVARQLPAQTAPFVDREEEMAAGERLLNDLPSGHVAIVLNCSGMTGVGKTSFVLELAHQHASRFSGGVLFVAMRSPNGQAHTPAEIAARIMRDLGVAPRSIPRDPQERLAMLRSTLVDTSVMLVFDDAYGEEQVRDLIPANSKSMVLVASRAPLSLGSAPAIDLTELANDDAIALLEKMIGDRVRKEPEAAAAIVTRCGGLPLALVVVAGRARRSPTRPLGEFAQARSNPIEELAALDDPHGTLRSTFASAIGTASAPARRLLLLLAALDVVDIEPGVVTALAQIDAGGAAQLLEELGDERLLVPLEGGSW
ncbi:MAG TPA: NB-ARC domain-containing protein, partial [Solirubrobacterales bacterium]